MVFFESVFLIFTSIFRFIVIPQFSFSRARPQNGNVGVLSFYASKCAAIVVLMYDLFQTRDCLTRHC